MEKVESPIFNDERVESHRGKNGETTTVTTNTITGDKHRQRINLDGSVSEKFTPGTKTKP
jgi:hypothetical protein